MATRKAVIGPRRPSYYRKTGKGSPWEVLVLNPHKLTGNPYEQHVGESRDECNTWAAERLAEIAEGIVDRKAGRTLGELLDAWLASVKADTERRPRTWIAHRTSVNRVPAKLRRVMAHELRPSELERWRSELLSKGMSVTTVRLGLNVVAMALDYGIRDDTATGGPLKGKPNVARPPYLPKLKRPKLTVPKACPRADREAIRAALCGHHRTVVDLCYGAGLRFSEARSITPAQLDAERCELRDVRQLNDYSDGHEWAPGMAEGKSVHSDGRTVPIPSWLVANLMESERLYGLSREGTYAHARTCDSPLDGSQWAEDLAAARERAGVATAWTAHSFRHAFASEHLANGVDIATVAAWLGDTVETTLRTYVHKVTDERPAVELPAPGRRESVGKRHLKAV